MSGYTPVFSEIYLGSLYGQWPAAAVWASLLPLCDQHGRIDIHPTAIAGMTGWPLDLLMQGIKQLSEPDEHSRTPDDDGRRLVPLEEGRAWGWKVVNHAKYREKARLTAKNAREVAEGKNRDRMAGRTAADRRSPPDTAADPLSNTNTNKNKKGADAPVALVEGLDPKAWADWLDYRKSIGKPLKPASYAAAQRDMAKLGAGQAAAVEHSKAKGWTGLFAPSGPPSQPPKKDPYANCEN